jgi:HD-GYP domain-containing protein (c-di-GMP phosphodiesterase class II)
MHYTSNLKLELENDYIFSMLNISLKNKDNITKNHASRIKNYIFKIAKIFDLDQLFIKKLLYLADMHDLGKLVIPDNILLKPGPLNSEEWEIMKKHPELGYKIASSFAELEFIAEGILYHHESWDGNGYPAGLRADTIPLESRIISVIDAYDAMTSDRPYQKAISKEEAVAELKNNAGTQFDPGLIDIFSNIFYETAIF